MNEAEQLKLQAFLDGELPEREAREILALTQRDKDAAALLAELRNTRQALTRGESQPALPESREFYWSKIQREIEQLEPRPASVPAFSFAKFLRRIFLPIGAFASLAVITWVSIGQFQKPAVVNADSMETVLTDEDAVTYQDQQEGTTLVWLSYPASGNSESAQPTHS